MGLYICGTGKSFHAYTNIFLVMIKFEISNTHIETSKLLDFSFGIFVTVVLCFLSGIVPLSGSLTTLPPYQRVLAGLAYRSR